MSWNRCFANSIVPNFLLARWLLPLFQPDGAHGAGSRVADILAGSVALDAMVLISVGGTYVPRMLQDIHHGRRAA
eukprot:1528092-Prorocentrum_lima.AAC.1